MFELETLSDLPSVPKSVDGYTQPVDTSTNTWKIYASIDGGQLYTLCIDRIITITTDGFPSLSPRAFRLVKLFLVHQVERRKAGTVSAYLVNLRKFTAWLVENEGIFSLPFNWFDLTNQMAESYSAYLHEMPHQATDPISTLYLLYQWGVHHQYRDFSKEIRDSLAEMPRGIYLKHRVIREQNAKTGAFDEEERLLIREAFEAGIGLPTERVIVMFCYYTGNRPHSLVRITNRDFEKVETSGAPLFYVHVPHSKKGTQLSTKMRFRLPIVLGQLLEELNQGGPEDKLLYWLSEKRPESQIVQTLKEWGHTANLVSPRTGDEINLTPGRFRHNLATKLAEMNASPLLIAATLGHRSLGTAQAYIETNERIGDTAGAALDALAQPLIDRFLNNTLPVNEDPSEYHPDDIFLDNAQINLLKTMKTGRCGQGTEPNDTCHKMPLDCYTCQYFHPFPQAEHREVSEHIKAYKEQHQYKVDKRILMQFDEVELAIDILLSQLESSEENTYESS